jgi:osmotically-inducible protein OsmY
MKKFLPLMLGGLLLLGATACGKPVVSDTDNSVRSDQMESDARAQEQRDAMGNSMTDEERQVSVALATEVQDKLASNLSGSQLTVEVVRGVATVKGNVLTQEQFDKIESLAMEVEGIDSVNVTAAVAPN